jgi:hypothetical protein
MVVLRHHLAITDETEARGKTNATRIQILAERLPRI